MRLQYNTDPVAKQKACSHVLQALPTARVEQGVPPLLLQIIPRLCNILTSLPC
jgi:hypothetical protein